MTVLSILLKVTVITGCGLLAVRAARRQRASLRHMFLVATFVLALLVPFITVFGPTICVTVPSVSQTIQRFSGPAVPPTRFLWPLRLLRIIAPTMCVRQSSHPSRCCWECG